VTAHRVGLIVPSSNVTVETEVPALLARHASARFSFHSSRMRMHTVSPEQLRAMNAQRERCVDELADADVDALLYACLVAIMAQGPGEHRRTEEAVAAQLAAAGQRPAVLSSAGALVQALTAFGASRIALVTPYLRPLAQRVVDCLESEGFEVLDWAALEVDDNAEVGRIPGDRVMAAARGLDLSGADALVISACVQMPSLELISPAEEEFGLPVLSAATAGAYALLRQLGLPAILPCAGQLLATGRSAGSGQLTATPATGSALQSPS
jgi:maleate isomerase